MFQIIYSWIDVIWLPIIFFGVHKNHKWWALGFGVSSIIITHLITETMVYIGHERGIMGLLDWHAQTRATVVSSFYYCLFLILAHFSKNTQGVVFMAACLSIFFMIFVTTSLVMLL